MNRPVWFYQSRIAGIPAHWTPCTWQGWLITAVFTAALIGVIFYEGPSAGTGRGLVTVIGMTAVMIAIAAMTSKDAPERR